MLNPSPALAKSSVDIVFIIDRSESMDSSINAVKNNVNHFADLLAARGVSYRLGLVSYEYIPIRYDLTSDVNTFKNQVGQIYTEGGIENGLDAIMDAAQNYPFDVNASKYFILIGDENIYSARGHTDASVIQYLKDNRITMTVIGTSGIQSQLINFTNQTGGQYLDLYTDFSTSLTSIFDQIQRIPTLEIISPTAGQTVSKLKTFIPSAKVTDPDSDTLHLAYYIDGEALPRDTKSVTNTTIASDKYLSVEAQAKIIALTGAYYKATSSEERKAIQQLAEDVRQAEKTNNARGKQTDTVTPLIAFQDDIYAAVDKGVKARGYMNEAEWNKITTSVGIKTERVDSKIDYTYGNTSIRPPRP